MNKIIILLIAVSISIVFAAPSNAELFDRGYGLIYDDVLDITWYDSPDLYNDGTMEWLEAYTWADELVVKGFNDWRLPATDPGCSGGDCTGNEMDHLFHNDNINADSFGLFTEIRPFYYWSSTEKAGDASKAWRFNFAGSSGTQGTSSKGTSKWAWAVRAGDSVPVAPEPASSILFLMGGLLFTAKRYWKRDSYK